MSKLELFDNTVHEQNNVGSKPTSTQEFLRRLDQKAQSWDPQESDQAVSPREPQEANIEEIASTVDLIIRPLFLAFNQRVLNYKGQWIAETFNPEGNWRVFKLQVGPSCYVGIKMTALEKNDPSKNSLTPIKLNFFTASGHCSDVIEIDDLFANKAANKIQSFLAKCLLNPELTKAETFLTKPQ